MAKSIANQEAGVQAIGRLSEWFRRAWESGLDLDDLQLMIDNPEKRADIIRYWKGYPEGTSHLAEAERIMTDSVLRISASRRLAPALSAKEVGAYNIVPLQRIDLADAFRRELYLVAMPSVNLQSLIQAQPNFFQDDCWPEQLKQDHTQVLQRNTRPGYHLMYAGGLPGSSVHTWAEQCRLQPKSHEAPYLVEMVLFYIASRLANGYPPFFGGMRCLDVVDGDHVVLRIASSGKVGFEFVLDDVRFPWTQVASGRYLPLVK